MASMPPEKNISVRSDMSLIANIFYLAMFGSELQHRKKGLPGTDRIEKLRRLFDDANIEALYVSSPENLYYLSGFTSGDGALLVSEEQVALLTDSRYLEQAKQESPGCVLVEMRDSYPDTLAAYLRNFRISKLGLDGKHLCYKDYHSFKDRLSGLNIVETGGLVEKLRLIKDGQEIDKIKTAVGMADQAFADVLPILKPGLSEREIALRLEYNMKRLGADDIAFKIIVASGARSALPHGVASGKRLETGDLVTMDFGAVFQGYHSDITRTMVIDEPDQQQYKIYQIVLEAHLKAMDTVRDGVVAWEVDKAARDIITANGYGEYFGHGTGHGLGLYIHEDPRLSQKDQTVLRKGMTVTIEPGIYLPGWGGVRIEDTVVVEDHGCAVLTGSPKMELISV